MNLLLLACSAVTVYILHDAAFCRLKNKHTWWWWWNI